MAQALETPGLLSGILSHLVSSGKVAYPRRWLTYLNPICELSCVSNRMTSSNLLQLDAGQPFRLNLWHCLSVLYRNPDMDFFHLLHESVPPRHKFAYSALQGAFPPDSAEEHVIPLQHCDSRARDGRNGWNKLLSQRMNFFRQQRGKADTFDPRDLGGQSCFVQ